MLLLCCALYCIFVSIGYVNGQTYEGMITAVSLLKGCSFQPSNILDVGANLGAWTKTFRQSVFKDASYFMIEGNNYHNDILKATGVPYVISLVGSTTGNATFYQYPDAKVSATGNSRFKENTDLFTDVVEVVRPIDTIDNIAAFHGLKPFQMVKMDIQGGEVDAIKGGIKTLRDVEVLITEAPVMNYNSGSPSFLQLQVLLHRLGFVMYDCVDLSRNKKGFLIQYDVIWVKITSSLWDESCTTYPNPYANVTINYNTPLYHHTDNFIHKRHGSIDSRNAPAAISHV